MGTLKNKKRLIGIIKKYRRGRATPEEIAFIEMYYQYFDKETKFSNTLSSDEKESLENNLVQKILVKLEKKTDLSISPFYTAKRSLIKFAAAAVILLLSGIGSYLVFFNRSPEPPVISGSQQLLKHDVAPGGNKAILMLADGSTIALDDTQNGVLAQQGGTKVLKLSNGLLAYDSKTENKKQEKVLYNTISTPRGGEYTITLPDGSRAWINAASSLRFPTAFTGKDRKVEITGEAYFEVKKDASKPFIVRVNNKVDVKVLGTHFNINAYADEPSIKTTLLEGRVSISRAVSSSSAINSSTVITPGQQAQLDARGIRVIAADVELAVAWKNGFTSFKSADIKTIMRQVERWYNVDVVYEKDISLRTFTGEISRNSNLSEVLRLLEASNIHFKVEGNKIIVTS